MSFDSFYANDSQTGILSEFGKTEEPEPEGSLKSCADWKQHLCEGQYIEEDTESQYDETCAKGKTCQPPFSFPEKNSES